jgi:hypothetical protein
MDGFYMIDTSLNIILGVVSGIVTSFLLLIITITINKIVLPWYFTLVYKGVDISGVWEGNLSDEADAEKATLYIKMTGNIVNIKMHIVKEKDDSVISYDFHGEVKDRLLTLHGRNFEKRTLSASVMLLEVLAGGNTLCGYESWYSTNTSSIKSASVCFLRKK